MQDNKKTGLDGIFSEITPDVIGSYKRMSDAATELNGKFGQNRERIIELMEAVADATPGVVRLGGKFEDVSKTMFDITEASKRNVVANAETVEKLYAANQLMGTLGEKSQVVLDSFLNVGVGINQIPEKLEKSINYIRSIGGNTKQIMGDVTSNLDKLNRYQFEGGVQGLTKMAAQASMLRFDMKQTFELADKVLDPNKAVEVASAFQRLGVSAGNLVDPFQLMNQSINDPSGLQDSLVNVAKQYSYFDEKTKTFKINPQGVLMLKELGKELDINAKELMELSISARELDSRLSAISTAGLTIASEEDKQYLANIAMMNEKGEYEVKIRNEEGREETRKLTEITQKEFDNLIKEQKTGPKTLQDLTRAQLDINKLMAADIGAIREKLAGGIASARQITTTVETVRTLQASTFGTMSSSNFGTTASVRKEMERTIGDVIKLGQDLLANPNKTTTQSLTEFLNKLGSQFDDIKGKLTGEMTKALQSVADQNAKGNEIQKKYSEAINYLLSGKEISFGGKDIAQILASINKGQLPVQPSSEKGIDYSKLNLSDLKLVLGDKKLSEVLEKINLGNIPEGIRSPGQSVSNILQKAEVAFGELKINLSLPDNFRQLSTEEIRKMLSDTFDSAEFKDKIMRLVTPQNPTKAPIK